MSTVHRISVGDTVVFEGIRDHLKRLSANDRWLRFCAPAHDDYIDGYVNKVQQDTAVSKQSVCFVVFDVMSSTKVVGFCHIAVLNETEVELAVSVDDSLRGAGIGGDLFDRAIDYCTVNGYTTVYMNCLSSNRVIQQLARNRNMKMITDYGDVVASLDLEDRDKVEAFLRDCSNETVALYDRNLAHMRTRFIAWVSMLASMYHRQSVDE